MGKKGGFSRIKCIAQKEKELVRVIWECGRFPHWDFDSRDWKQLYDVLELVFLNHHSRILGWEFLKFCVRELNGILNDYSLKSNRSINVSCKQDFQTIIGIVFIHWCPLIRLTCIQFREFLLCFINQRIGDIPETFQIAIQWNWIPRTRFCLEEILPLSNKTIFDIPHSLRIVHEIVLIFLVIINALHQSQH